LLALNLLALSIGAKSVELTWVPSQKEDCGCSGRNLFKPGSNGKDKNPNQARGTPGTNGRAPPTSPRLSTILTGRIDVIK